MPILVQYNFPYSGPFGAAMSAAYQDLAGSIASEPGLLWKLWIENPATRESGGIYLFRDRTSADAYVRKHSARLAQFGLSGVSAKSFEVNEPLSAITGGSAVLLPSATSARSCST